MDNELITIDSKPLEIKDFKGQRVVTFKDIDSLHERVEGTAGRNFRENKEHFIEGVDYFNLNGNILAQYKQATNFVGSNAKELTILTESGYLMVVKSLKDDLAWKVQRELVNSYFRVKKYNEILEIAKMVKSMSNAQCKVMQLLIPKEVKSIPAGNDNDDFHVQEFLNLHCEESQSPKEWTFSYVIHNAYVEFCKQNNYKDIASKNILGRMLKQKRYRKGKYDGYSRFYLTINLRRE